MNTIKAPFKMVLDESMSEIIRDVLAKELNEEYTLKKVVDITVSIYVGEFEDEFDRYDIYDQIRKHTSTAVGEICMSGKYHHFDFIINSNFIYGGYRNIEINFTIVRRGDEW